jgi:osmotically-inducible protein OsmY
VDASGLVIDQFTDDGTLRATPGRARSDADLEQSLLDAFVRDPRVHPFSPAVAVRGGVVLLMGLAPNVHVARAVDDDARALPGVGAVRDELRALPAAGAASMQPRR